MTGNPAGKSLAEFAAAVTRSREAAERAASEYAERAVEETITRAVSGEEAARALLERLAA